MAWSTSYVSAAALAAALTGAVTLNLGTSNSGLKLALFDNTVTPSPDGLQHYGSAPWNSGEVFGTGWPQGGIAVSLSGTGLTAEAGGILKFAAGSFSQSGTTLTTPVQGAIIYDTGNSGLVICAVFFGGSGYTTSVEPFGITWPSSGVFTVALVPGT